MRKKNTLLLLSIICSAAAAMRLIFFLFAGKPGFAQPYEYDEIAKNLLEGNGFLLQYLGTSYKAAVAPVFPFMCAAVYRIFGYNHAYIVVLQIVMSVAMCYFVFRIGQMIFGDKAGLLAAALVACHPGLIVYSTKKLHALNLYAFLVCVVLYMILKVRESPTARNRLILGVSFGFCLLERSIFLPFFLLAIWWLCRYMGDKKKAAIAGLQLAVMAVLIVSPWLIRNYSVYKEFIFIQTNQWQGLWVGNNPDASGTLLAASDMAIVDKSPAGFREKLYSLDELGQMKLFKDSAITYIKENPFVFLGNTLKKFFYFWWFSPQSGILYPSIWLKLYMSYYAAVAFFALLGLARVFTAPALREYGVLLVLLFLSSSLLQSFYYVEGRHRWAIEPLLLVFTAGGVYWLRAGFRKGKGGKSVVA